MIKRPKVKREHIYATILLFVAVTYIPLELTISPRRQFRVINADNEPIEGALSKQVWYQYCLDYTEEDEIKSDSDGMISFPRRAVKTTLVSLVSGGISRIVEFKLDASLGSTDSIGVLVEGHDWKWFYDGIGLESGAIRFAESEQ